MARLAISPHRLVVLPEITRRGADPLRFGAGVSFSQERMVEVLLTLTAAVGLAALARPTLDGDSWASGVSFALAILCAIYAAVLWATARVWSGAALSAAAFATAAVLILVDVERVAAGIFFAYAGLMIATDRLSRGGIRSSTH